MKKFSAFYPEEFTQTENGFVVCGRSMGDEPIAIGDIIGGCRVVKIEAYRRSLGDCPPGLTARMTLETISPDKPSWLDVDLIARSPDTPPGV